MTGVISNGSIGRKPKAVITPKIEAEEEIVIVAKPKLVKKKVIIKKKAVKDVK